MDLSSRASVTNRSVPACTVIPVLAYDDVGQAVNWLCDFFGFTVRLRIGTHRAQLMIGDGAVIVSERPADRSVGSSDSRSLRSQDANGESHSVLVQVSDVDRHYEHARQRGAYILNPPTDYPYGERQYSVEDPGGHRWTFSQSITDVDPAEWGGRVAGSGER